jgi:cytochrome c peroxidase
VSGRGTPAGGALRSALTALLICTTAPACAAGPRIPYEWRLPRGFEPPAVPADNPMSVEKVRLGRALFFDPRISVTGRYSCASCHDPARAFTDGRRTAIGATGGLHGRNTATLANAAYGLSFGWDSPSLQSLEQQMQIPLFNEHPVEIGLRGREALLLESMRGDMKMATAFARAFPDENPALTITNLIKAIACFERTLVVAGSAFDRYVFDGEHDALRPEAKRGMRLFFSAEIGCANCHAGITFAGPWRDARGSTGAARLVDNGIGFQSRVPTLRQLRWTAPYMHDGRFASLSEVLEHYGHAGGSARVDLRLPQRALDAPEQAELVAFLMSLSSDEPGAP